MSIRKSTLHFQHWLNQLDRRLVRFMSIYGVHLLRWSVAILYLWFGVLKLVNDSPASELLEGQYAIKNLVLITAGLVIGSTVRQSKTREP